MKNWTIFKGWHFSLSNILSRFKLRRGTAPISVDLNFHESCWFKYKDADDNDVNKLVGVSFGRHHTNSVRVGWVPNFDKKDKIALYFYTYNNGIRSIVKFKEIWCGLNYTLIIRFSEKENTCTFNLYRKDFLENEKAIPFVIPKTTLGYYLWPYFGGNKTAPHTMKMGLDVG